MSFRNTPTNQIRSVAIIKTSFMSLPLQTAEMEATCSGLRSMPGLSSLLRAKNSARSKLFDPGKLCRPINDIRSSTSWLHGYNTIVHDFLKISGKLSACANSGYQALLSRAGRAWERGYPNSNPLPNSISLRFITTYSPSLQHLHKTLCLHWDLISQDSHLNQLFSTPQLCFR